MSGTIAPNATRPLPGWLAIALVTGTSGAVLVLEILAGRVMAPYVGVNLETYTAIIGTILAGIAVGARVGGSLADRHDPRGLIPLLLMLGGALAIASVPVVRLLGGTAGANTQGLPSVLLAAVGFLPSAAVLSAVPPAVIKLQLRDLDRTGDVVGRLSAWSTGGAIVGTFLAGFVLVAFAAVSTLILSVGVALVVAGGALWLTDRATRHVATSSALAIAAVAAGGHALVPQPCDVQSSYYCISIEVDADDPSGRILVLDDLRHSYVDLDDATHLDFWYIRQIVGAIDTLAPSGPLDVVALGGGAMTVPRYLDETRPGSAQAVLEIDPTLVDVVRDDLGVDTDPFEIVVGDGRLSLRDRATDSADVVVGDAFGSRAVPWHLATEEFMTDIARVLRPGGLYVANIIDGSAQSFLQAEAATIRSALPFVAVMPGEGLTDGLSGNAVVVASDRPVDAAAWNRARIERGDPGSLVADIDDYLDGALVLTDDFAPVDQLVVGTR
ncbi:MAG: fused MFS/spermidine synthase [Ilumatobacteraceae bacterium]|nr:fused MFS/spermidine synthase [Ilumatobacteraceae bacterium]